MFLSWKRNKSFKFFNEWIFLLFFLVLVLNNCEEDNTQQRSYPQVRTRAITDISSKGATFNADIYTLGIEKITEHGFMWAEEGSDFNGSNRILLGSAERTGLFSAEILTTLRKDSVYSVKSFVQTKNHLVYGIPVKFTSMGSGTPVIFGFAPDSASWLDTITIRGKNFAWKAEENFIRFNNIECTTLTATDTTITILVSTDLNERFSIVSVELAGNIAVHRKDTFRLIQPVITDFYPKQARWMDTLTVFGINLQTIPGNKFSSTIGGFSAETNPKGKDTIIIIVPKEINRASNLLEIKINSMDFPVSEKMILVPPLINSIYPKEGPWNTIITIKGKFNPAKEYNSIRIGGFATDILSICRDSISFTAPLGLSSQNNLITLSSSPFSVVSADTFKLLGPKLISVSPLSGLSGTNVTINGEFFGDIQSTTVSFNSTNASIVSMSGSVINCKVPSGLPEGPAKIIVTTRLQSTIFKGDFSVTIPQVYKPIITRVIPLTGTFRDQITIEGENLTGTYGTGVYFIDDQNAPKYAPMVSSSAKKLIVEVPLVMDSIPKKILVRVDNETFTYSECFVLDPPEIVSISSPFLTPGQNITISGKNFNPYYSYNDLFWGSAFLNVISSTSTEIHAKVPTSILSGFEKIKIMAGGYKRYSSESYEFRSPWSSISFPFEWNSDNELNNNGVAFSVLGLGYMVDYFDGHMTSFNPLTYEFKDLGIHSELKLQGGLSYVVRNDTLLMVGGDLGLLRYDVGMNKWINVGTCPTNTRNGITFSLNGQLFTGLNFGTTLEKKLWVYDESLKVWNSRSDLPGFSVRYPVAYFSIGDKGYVLFADNVFCEYDPVNDIWTKLSSHPGPGPDIFGRSFFVDQNKGYVGLGRETHFGGKLYDSYWFYDTGIKNWIQSTFIPDEGTYNSVTFFVNKKAYIGFGYGVVDNQKNGFYEFDPYKY